MERIQSAALDNSLDPLVASTDVFMTAVCWVGSKSLSHVLACVERTKERLVDFGAASDAARGQIITAVMAYWRSHPGVAVSIVEKLLNYSILTPFSVVEWALVDSSTVGGATNRGGASLAHAHVFEMVFNTTAKVTGRLRQVVNSAEVDDEVRAREIKAMRDLFRAMEDALVSWAGGSKDEMMEDGDGSSEQEALIRDWGQKWLRVFRRRAAVEEAFLLDAGRDRMVTESTYLS